MSWIQAFNDSVRRFLGIPPQPVSPSPDDDAASSAQTPAHGPENAPESSPLGDTLPAPTAFHDGRAMSTQPEPTHPEPPAEAQPLDGPDTESDFDEYLRRFDVVDDEAEDERWKLGEEGWAPSAATPPEGADEPPVRVSPPVATQQASRRELLLGVTRSETEVAEEAEEDPAALPEGRFADRELSWLAFNQRVIEQAEDTELPLLERAWFLAIFASNLDEFFMVRVAGLKRRIAAGMAVTAASGLTPRQVMEGISLKAHELTERHARVFQDDVAPALAAEGIRLVHFAELPQEEKDRLEKYYRQQIFPVLTPLAVDPAHPFPYISGLSLNLAVVLRNPTTGKDFFARVKVPQLLPRFIAVDSQGTPRRPEDIRSDEMTDTAFVPLEEIMGAFLDRLFPGMEIVEWHTFRVTRNEDLEVEEDDAENLLKAIEKELLKRRFGNAVRLEVAHDISEHVLDLLMRELGVTEADVYRLPEPLDLRGMNLLHDLDRPDLKYPKYVPVTARQLARVESATPIDFFQAISNEDILLHHPYDSFSTSVQQFLAQAAADPQVLAIKQTLYRTSGDSPIIDSLIDAAQAGKQVLAIVEIKARFDEENNIGWARKLEQAGVHVVYGLVGLKTHCKLILVVRQEADGLKRYCHVGTGNYNPKTARGYEDLGLLTCNRDVGQDLTRLFNQLSGYAPRTKFRRLLVAPRGIRAGLIERIERETANFKAGKPAWIKFKVNSIVDEATIDALYRASQAGVPVQLTVRGICAVRAGIEGLSENIQVRSILGRYLEHSRIYAFANDGTPEVWIGSADLMHRNLDRRVEALIQLEDPQHVAQLLDLLDLAAADTTMSWRLQSDGAWVRHYLDEHGNRLTDMQDVLMARARSRVAAK